MELVLKRIFKGNKYTIGRLYWKPPYIDYGEHEEVLKDQYNDDIEKEYICDTLEDTDRGLTKDMTLDEINNTYCNNDYYNQAIREEPIDLLDRSFSSSSWPF